MDINPTQNRDNVPNAEPTPIIPELQLPTRKAQSGHRFNEAYIGPYRVTRPLGQGAFGVVYLAYQPFLDRQVALKILHSELGADSQFERQFMHEARAIAKLRHPNIVTVYEFGTIPIPKTLLPYLVMEYLPGETLYAKLRRGPLGILEAVEITEQLAEGLDYAHAHGVIHHDLKPANIMFFEQQQPVIVDFGLARLVEMTGNRDLSKDTRHSGTAAGTPAYMSPEQALGQFAGPASDQYALALITYEMLTGQQVYTGGMTAALSPGGLEIDIPSLSTAAPHLPAAGDAVLRRALRREPESRYPTASAFAEALLPNRVASRIITVADPAQAAQLQSAQQSLLGFMWGLVLLTSLSILFSLALLGRGFVQSDPPFMWDGIIASSFIHDGFRDVIGLWPDGPAQKAGVQIGDMLKTDIDYDRLRQDGDYTINGLPRSAYPVNWPPQEGDRIERTVLRNGQPVKISYQIKRSPYLLIVVGVQLLPAVLALGSAIWVLRRWGAEPSARLAATVLLAGCFAVTAAGVTNVLTNLDIVALSIFLPLLLHMVLVFPQPHGRLVGKRNRLWLLYLPLPIGFIEFVLGTEIFGRFNVAIYASYSIVLIGAIMLKWVGQDLKRYRPLRLLIGSLLLASSAALLGEAIMAFDDYETVQRLWNGNGLILQVTCFSVIAMGTTLAVLLGTIGFHRVQLLLGRSSWVAPESAGKSPVLANWDNHSDP